MSYDLALRRVIPGSVARDDAEGGRIAPSGISFERGLLLPTALGLASAAGALLMLASSSQRVRKSVEGTYYRATWRDVGTTQEVPAVTSHDLVYGPRED